MTPQDFHLIKRGVSKGSGIPEDHLFVSYDPRTHKLEAGEAWPNMTFPEGTLYIIPDWASPKGEARAGTSIRCTPTRTTAPATTRGTGATEGRAREEEEEEESGLVLFYRFETPLL